jgi:hypothetical protein
MIPPEKEMAQIFYIKEGKTAELTNLRRTVLLKCSR